MGFWRDFGNWLVNTPNHDGITPNEGGPLDYNPGDPNGVELLGEETFNRSLPFPAASPWSGWPSSWNTPNWVSNNGIDCLIDVAWTCIDLNSSVLSAMPVYRTQGGRIMPPRMWMLNPDDTIYTCWQEFAKQLFWDYHLGEAFVLPTDFYADGKPRKFRVIPAPFVTVEMRGDVREYHIGAINVTDRILHIRYQSRTTDARGRGPLDGTRHRATQMGLVQRYASKLIESGGTPHYWIGVDQVLTKEQAIDLLDQWIETRKRYAGEPAIISRGGKLNQTQAMNAKDMALLEIEQFNAAQIAVALGVPPFLVALPNADSMTYSNVESLFDFHDRASLKSKATAVMQALSYWALPYGQAAELNRDEYTRPGPKERAQTYAILAGIVDPKTGEPAIGVPEIRAAERFSGPQSAVSLTGGDDTSVLPMTGGEDEQRA